MQNGQLSLAEQDFRRVIALDPKSSAAYVNLDVAYMREKRWDDALVQLHKAESLSPDRQAIEHNNTLVNSYFGLAKLYREASQYQEALEMLDHTEALAPLSASVHYIRGQVLGRLGQFAKGASGIRDRGQLAQVVQRSPATGPFRRPLRGCARCRPAIATGYPACLYPPDLLGFSTRITSCDRCQ